MCFKCVQMCFLHIEDHHFSGGISCFFVTPAIVAMPPDMTARGYLKFSTGLSAGHQDWLMNVSDLRPQPAPIFIVLMSAYIFIFTAFTRNHQNGGYSPCHKPPRKLLRKKWGAEFGCQKPDLNSNTIMKIIPRF